MQYHEVLAALKRDNLEQAEMFAILKAVSHFVNDKGNIARGRDLIIRLLARRKLLDGFETRILTSFVRAVGLYPYMSEVLEFAEVDDRMAYELHRPDNIPEVFHSLQARIYYQLRSGVNVVLSASTSVGKSLVIDAIIALRKHRKIVIVVPTLALIDETRKRISQKFRDFCNVITHPTQTAQSGMVNVYVLTQERVKQRIDLSNVDFFVIDEFYKLDFRREDDNQRAVDLNLAFHRLATTGAQFYMLGPNIQAIKGLDKYEIHFIPSEYSTVAVDVFSYNLPTQGDDRPNKLVEICQGLTTPTLVYCQGPTSAMRISRLLIRECMRDLVPACAGAADWIADAYHPDWIVAEALRHGIGIHHGGVPRALQQNMVRMFNDGLLPIMVCTSTLIEGVNTVAENVIVYDRRRNNKVLDFFTYRNIQGRAGRMGRYFIGNVFLLEKPPEDAEVSVEYPVGLQDADTPLTLVMQLDDEALTDESRTRLEDALERNFLSAATVLKNGSVEPAVQDLLAKEMFQIMQQDPTVFSWRSNPSQTQLIAACRLMLRHLWSLRTKGLGVNSPEHLAWYVRALASPDGIKGYLTQITQDLESKEATSLKVDEAMKILRNILIFKFPQDLMVLSSIQAELAQRLEIAVGDFGFFAETVENLYLPALLVALEEYGLPIPIGRKIQGYLSPFHDLTDVLNQLRAFNAEHAADLSTFERSLIEAIQGGV
ncbi:DEAD/DEAH box helicase [Rhizobium ruizarguesonis]